MRSSCKAANALRRASLISLTGTITPSSISKETSPSENIVVPMRRSCFSTVAASNGRFFAASARNSVFACAVKPSWSRSVMERGSPRRTRTCAATGTRRTGAPARKKPRAFSMRCASNTLNTRSCGFTGASRGNVTSSPAFAVGQERPFLSQRSVTVAVFLPPTLTQKSS